MGFRFRRSIRLGGGLRINLSKSGASLPVGRPGATVNLGRRGARATVGLPGSGLSYSTTLHRGRRKSSAGSVVAGIVIFGVVVWLFVRLIHG
jgi:hypothetical protein